MGCALPEGVVPDLYSLPHAGFEVLPLPDQQNCYSAAQFRLADMAFVSADLPAFSSPYLLEEGPLAELPAGELVELMEGPKCIETSVMWRVHGLTSGLAGWVDQAGLKP
jgi:hypothetical protein